MIRLVNADKQKSQCNKTEIYQYNLFRRYYLQI